MILSVPGTIRGTNTRKKALQLGYDDNSPMIDAGFYISPENNGGLFFTNLFRRDYKSGDHKISSLSIYNNVKRTRLGFKTGECLFSLLRDNYGKTISLSNIFTKSNNDVHGIRRSRMKTSPVKKALLIGLNLSNQLLHGTDSEKSTSLEAIGKMEEQEAIDTFDRNFSNFRESIYTDPWPK